MNRSLFSTCRSALLVVVAALLGQAMALAQTVTTYPDYNVDPAVTEWNATSGIAARSWRKPDGSVAHHLLDPSTGEPCRTGLIGATALAPTALEAEVLAKWAVLAGPVDGLELLARNGGLVVHRDGRVEIAGEARVRFRLPPRDSGTEGRPR